MKKRVVITGLGVVAPNGVGLDAFTHAIKNGVSGIKKDPELERLQFSCQISGKPEVSTELSLQYFSELELRNFNSTGILYGVIAGIDAWKDAGLSLEINEEPDWDSGTIFGTGTSGIDKFRESIYKIDDFQTRRLGSTAVAQTMNSGVSAYLGGKLGLGNQVTTNSSACTTGTENPARGKRTAKRARSTSPAGAERTATSYCLAKLCRRSSLPQTRLHHPSGARPGADAGKRCAPCT